MLTPFIWNNVLWEPRETVVDTGPCAHCDAVCDFEATTGQLVVNDDGRYALLCVNCFFSMLTSERIDE
jgi:hypothetical protein